MRGQAEPLAERVGERHAGLGADDDEGRVVGGEPRRRRLQVPLVDDVLDEVAGAEGAQVEAGRARTALHVDDRQAGGGEARRQPRAGRVGVDDDRGAGTVMPWRRDEAVLRALWAAGEVAVALDVVEAGFDRNPFEVLGLVHADARVDLVLAKS